MLRKWGRTVLTVALPAMLLTACVSSTQQGATGVSRKQFMLLSSDEVNAMSLQSYTGELNTGRQKGILNADKATLERIRRIADRLIPQTAVFRPDAPAWKWEVNLETSNEVNAYCAPGGKIMFYTGLIQKLNLSDDEIAAVMGHEISHALREHGRERMSQAYAQQIGLSLAGSLLGMSDTEAALAQNVAQMAITLPHSRGQESEADVLGLELSARAGYDPRAALSLWKKMSQLGDSGPAFLSTHPSSPERMQNLQARLPQVMPLYKAAQTNGATRAPRVVPRT